MDTPLETKHRYVVKRDGVSVTRGRYEMRHPRLTKRSIGVTQKASRYGVGAYGKTQYRAPNETLYTLAVRPVLGRSLTMNNSFTVLRLR